MVCASDLTAFDASVKAFDRLVSLRATWSRGPGVTKSCCAVHGSLDRRTRRLISAYHREKFSAMGEIR